MIRMFCSPKAYISKVLCSEDYIVRKVLFRRFDTPKVLYGYLCSETPIVRWLIRLRTVRWIYDPMVRLIWFNCKGKCFCPSTLKHQFCRVKFPKCLKQNISIQMFIKSIDDEWCIHMTRGRVMRCQRGQTPMIIHVSWVYITVELNHSL